MNSLQVYFPEDGNPGVNLRLAQYPLDPLNPYSALYGNFFASNGLQQQWTGPACKEQPNASYKRFNGPGDAAFWTRCFGIQRLWPNV